MFQFFDAGLGRVQRLFLHNDRLRHVVWGAGLPGNLIVDEAFRFGIARRRLPLDVGKFLEKIADRLLVVPVHGKHSDIQARRVPRDFRDALQVTVHACRCSKTAAATCMDLTRLFALAGEVQQQLEDVDEV
ncbi:hypothetical protein MES4922_30514 [Mesorhizobium ventifaucium]|uniref:Uncharacterized protein n=1 Tax=Mesorhizobium ventifaucium TaxID=666020 RepID=A0ABN8JYW7_9HYPH|nr:hypothetical protein MES4922_30514 [Mesorhizobium ventifaucium]